MSAFEFVPSCTDDGDRVHRLVPPDLLPDFTEALQGWPGIRSSFLEISVEHHPCEGPWTHASTLRFMFETLKILIGQT